MTAPGVVMLVLMKSPSNTLNTGSSNGVMRAEAARGGGGGGWFQGTNLLMTHMERTCMHGSMSANHAIRSTAPTSYMHCMLHAAIVRQCTHRLTLRDGSIAGAFCVIQTIDSRQGLSEEYNII